MPAALLEQETDAEEAVAQIEALVNAPWFPPIIDPRFFAFIKAEGRVPRFGDVVPPWSYSGFLLFQVMALSGSRGIHSRWVYYFETLAAGRLLDRPIPPLNFDAPEDAKARVMKGLGKLVEKLGREHGYGERALNVLIEWIAFGLGCSFGLQPDLPAPTSRWLYEHFDITQLLTAPNDYLGTLLEQFRGKSKRYQGFFLTHEHVCELMTTLAADDYDGDLRVARVYEPAAGSARQLLQFSGLSHNLVGQDIDPICVQISLINGALYAPWITFPLPTAILQTARVAEDARPAIDSSHPERPHTPPAPEVTTEPEEASGGGQPAEYRQSSLFDL
jgi:hypothetical protein